MRSTLMRLTVLLACSSVYAGELTQTPFPPLLRKFQVGWGTPGEKPAPLSPPLSVDPLSIRAELTGSTGSMGRLVPDGWLSLRNGKSLAWASIEGSQGFEKRALIRFLQDGKLDPGFGTAGMLELPESARYERGLLEDPQGRILAKGAYGPAQIVRRNPDGTLDPTFGKSGVVDFPTEENGEVLSVHRQNDDKLIVLTYERPKEFPFPGRPAYLLMTRFLETGAIDPSFGAGGSARVPEWLWMSGGLRTGSIVLAPDGRIFALATYQGDKSNCNYLVAFTRDGQIDRGFGEQGFTVFRGQFWENAVLRKLVLAGDALYLLGNRNIQTQEWRMNFFLARLDLQGRVTLRYGRRGLVDLHTVTSGYSVRELFAQFLVSDLLFQPDGKLLLTGNYYGQTLAGGHYEMGVAFLRLTSAGEVDSTFGDNGVAAYQGPLSDQGVAMNLWSGSLRLGTHGQFTLFAGGATSYFSSDPRRMGVVFLSGEIK